jgi:ribosome maturation factor RimP
MSLLLHEKWVTAHFFCFLGSFKSSVLFNGLFSGHLAMAHPLIPKILELAAPVAEGLGLEVVAAVFQTNQRPPVLRVDVRNLGEDTGLADCERMSRALEPVLDEAGIIADAYVLEVSSPGVSRQLESDREFISFQGFPVTVSAVDPVEGQQEWLGNLIKRDETAVHLSLKGRAIAVPRTTITRVQLSDSQSE